MESTPTIDTIVIGGSAGAFDHVRALLAALPPDLPACVLVCLHTTPDAAPHRLSGLLAYAAKIPVRTAEDGLPLEPGTAVIAVPDRHMMIGRDHLHLRRGAHENNFRPAIDPLFRSAAIYRGPRAVGVVLSGLLDDGAAGLRAMDRCGARNLVIDPDAVDFPDMPRAALAAVPGAERVAPEALAARLAELAGSPCAEPEPVPVEIGVELKIAGLEDASMSLSDSLGELSPYNCPHCNGVLWRIDDGPIRRFRCHTGHAYTIDALSQAQEEALDRGLFDALRAHRGRVALVRELAESMPSDKSAASMHRRADRIEDDARRLEEIIRTRAASQGRGADGDSRRLQ